MVLGRRLHYVDYGSGPPVVLVHGVGGCWQWWLENLPELGLSSRVIAVDLPGFGDSEPLPSPGEMSSHVETLAALLDQLELDRVVLVGHSLGGLIAMMFAIQHPNRLDGLVSVCGGGIVIGRRRLDAIVKGFLLFNGLFSRTPRLVRALALRPRLRRLMFEPFTGHPETLSAALAAQILPRMAAPGFADAVVSGARMASEIDPVGIATPTLLIWGERDPILPVARARELAGRMPQARLIALDGVGHCPMFESRDVFNAALSGFVATQ